MLRKRKIKYVSPADEFLKAFDQRHPPSASQKAEVEKFLRVAALRDGKPQTEPGNLAHQCEQ